MFNFTIGQDNVYQISKLLNLNAENKRNLELTKMEFQKKLHRQNMLIELMKMSGCSLLSLKLAEAQNIMKEIEK